jgi:RNA polymerase sigma factor (sigma-70 family)
MNKREDAVWAELVDRHTGRIRSVAHSYRLAAHDVDDVIQTTWLRLLENRDSIREPGAVGAWLATTARRTSLRVIERSARELPTDAAIDAPADDDIDDRLAALERRAAVDAALAELPAAHRELMLRLVSDSEPSYAEVAAELRIPVGSVGPTRGRCLQRLRYSPALRAVA